MSTLKAKTEAKIAAGRSANPEFMQGVDDIIAKAKEFQQGGQALAVGQQAPRFNLPNQVGTRVELDALLREGPVVLTFYRGSWCPYCNLQLNALQQRLPEIHALGAQLVAISPQVPDGTLSPDEVSALDFVVLSDQDANEAARYGVAWQVPDFLIEHMRVDRKLDLESINNGNANVLPIPATFVLDTSGEVVWRYVDVDYRTRAEPEDIVRALKALH
ncbi:peroxiredoxin-like family protein [Gilvimarinus agarilyticus]|uniref:peroxiredoxin-like family protein n=1 Tax=Gilvimarinus agarilyticus TaxID=679259 RepID=UPI0005A1B8D0|nr:peroxiredoxin-like family protein [Gilvimarinus agarilyticus]